MFDFDLVHKADLMSLRAVRPTIGAVRAMYRLRLFRIPSLCHIDVMSIVLEAKDVLGLELG